MNGGPIVSIIIRCKDNWQLTKHCIESIDVNTNPELYRLIIVDDGSIDKTKENIKNMPKSLYHEQILISHEKSLGAVSATNTGLEYYLKNPTPYVLILDNDTEILKGNTTWLNDMMKYFEEDESVGIVGACSNNVIGLQNVSHITEKKLPKYLISFCMMMSLKCVKKIGLWDERFNPGNCEDLDITLSARRKGFILKVAKDVFIEHHCHQTFNSMGLPNLLQTNERKLLEKWGEHLYYDLRK